MLAPLVLSGSPVNVKRDFAPIALMFTFPFLLVVNPDLGVKTLKELGRLRQGAAGTAQLGLARRRHRRSSGDRTAAQATGIKGQHVPYPGTTQQLMAAAAGTLQFTFDTPGNSQGIRDAGKVIALGRHRRQALGVRARSADIQGTGLRGLRRSACRQRLAGAEGHAAKGDRGVRPARW